MRKARIESKSGIYHVMMRGNNHQSIFRKDEDKKYFVFLLQKYLSKLNLELYAWCLMDNHFHLLIKSSKNTLADFIKRICCSYVPYFNRKYERSGHLFQDRFKSEPIEDDKYFLGVIRYIHNNPEKAHICPTEEYKWSSYNEYKHKKCFTSTEKLISMISGKSHFENYSKDSDSHIYLENKPKIWDNQAKKILNIVCKSYKIANLYNCQASIKKKILYQLLKEGLYITQISRITKISRTYIRFYLKE